MMTGQWFDRLRSFWLRRFGRQAVPPSLPKKRGRGDIVAINLGIDFGTSFTKVTYQDIGTEHTGIVTFRGPTIDDAMIPSDVVIDESGRLCLNLPDGPHEDTVVSRYLKMRLAEVPISDQLPRFRGIALNTPEIVRTLSSWFLATVILRAQAWIKENEPERLKGREIQWSANVGVPVEHYDSPKIEVFKEVLAVAWSWAKNSEIPSTVEQAAEAYETARARFETESTDFHAVPEIAAAVQSFIVSREAVPDFYVYFDIGGGTVDGVAFRYANMDGEKIVNFYSGKVEPLGVAAIAGRVGSERAAEIELALATDAVDEAMGEKLASSRDKIQKMVAKVIMDAKRSSGRNWQRNKIQNTARPRRTLARLDRSQMAPLLIFVGGGGAGSEWYQDAILGTYDRFGHENAGIPPYELLEVPKPPDLEMNGIDKSDFNRFAIAYGLSVPYGEGPEIGLPSQVPAPQPPHRRPTVSDVEYLDSKDVCG